MVRYLSLITFTDKGIREAAKSVECAENFQSAVESKGGKVLSQYWILGDIDGCVVFECPDDKTAAALLLTLGKEHNVRTNSMRVFDAAEIQDIL